MKYLFTVVLLAFVVCVQRVYALPLMDTVIINGSKADKYISPSDFTSLGDWKIDGFDLAFQKFALTGVFSKKPQHLQPASVAIRVTKPGHYGIWVSSLDLPANQPGSRFFYIKLDGRVIQKKFGTHNQQGFRWDKAAQLFLNEGVHLIEIIDASAFYARTEGLYITAAQNISSEGVLARVKELSLSYEAPLLPAAPIASSRAIKKKTERLSNNTVSVDFFELFESGHSLIENEIKVNNSALNNRRSSLGMVLLKANSTKVFYHDGFPIFQNKFLVSPGKEVLATNSNPYKAFLSEWILPQRLERLNDSTILLTYETADIIAESRWQLKKGDAEPVVQLTIKAKTPGAYSIIVPGLDAITDNSYSFALAPMRVTNKHVHPQPVVYTEQYLFTPMVTVTYPANGSNVTSGYTVDPSALKLKWTYKENNQFGMLLRNQDNKISPSIIAPFPGSDAARFDRNQLYTFVYRPLLRKGDWYDTYSHVVKDIFKLRDYRENYYATLNDAIFNTTQLMMDDYYGGWDTIGKAHWNMEGRSFSSNANPVQALQSYLLSDEDTMLNKRVIPTLANLLTRGHLHFKWNSLQGGANYFGAKAALPRPVGKPVAGYNASVFLGIFSASQGRIPYFRKIAEEKAKEKVVNSYGSIPSFVNKMAAFRLSGDSSLLKQIADDARKYVQEKVYPKETGPVDYSLFSYISYVPNLASLLDVYELTGCPEFLQAAEEAGRLLLTQLWVPGITPGYVPDSLNIKADEIKAQPFNEGYDFFWHGSEVWRLGSRRGVKGPPENLDILKDEKVPYWVPSRVGLGLEQPSTFYNESLNMIMSSWAGDLMKLAGYTGDTLFSTAARNAIIGRFSNYPGYYQNRFITIQQKKDYPYTGPDFSSIYWHHIPPFLSQLQDFLFGQAKLWSSGKVSFPSFRQQGYAYFNSNQYGHKSGRFFDETGMWPWLAKEIVSTGNRQIDWLAARKDGVAGIAFMNESALEITTTISLGAALGAGYTGPASLWWADGTTQKVFIKEGKLTLMLRGHTLVGLVIKDIDIKKPSFADNAKGGRAYTDHTISEHEYGKGLILQVNPRKYFAYVYLTDQPGALKSAVLNYRIGTGQWQRSRTAQYPFEFIIEVDRAKEEFGYFIELDRGQGKIDKTKQLIIKPVDVK